LLTVGAVLAVLLAVPGTGNAAPADYIASVVSAARGVQQQHQVPASVAIGQSILESGWGSSGLTRDHNNYFGIKCASPGNPGPIAIGCQPLSTQECRPTCGPEIAHFRVYRSREDSFLDYGRLLRTVSLYAPAFDYVHDPDQFIRIVGRHYATDPNYANKVIRLMVDHNLYQYNGLSHPVGDPLGAVDILDWDEGAKTLRVAGWSFDPDLLWSKTSMGLWMDSQPVRDLGETNVEFRTDVNAAWDPVFGMSIGDWHGYDYQVTGCPVVSTGSV
jgi:hypothetical protein